jgi:hypothetical protein
MPNREVAGSAVGCDFLREVSAERKVSTIPRKYKHLIMVISQFHANECQCATELTILAVQKLCLA